MLFGLSTPLTDRDHSSRVPKTVIFLQSRASVAAQVLGLLGFVAVAGLGMAISRGLGREGSHGAAALACLLVAAMAYTGRTELIELFSTSIDAADVAMVGVRTRGPTTRDEARENNYSDALCGCGDQLELSAGQRNRLPRAAVLFFGDASKELSKNSIQVLRDGSLGLRILLNRHSKPHRSPMSC
jgi:hypothetical protein